MGTESSSELSNVKDTSRIVTKGLSKSTIWRQKQKVKQWNQEAEWVDIETLVGRSWPRIPKELKFVILQEGMYWKNVSQAKHYKKRN
jgi:hypothetical protein